LRSHGEGCQEEHGKKKEFWFHDICFKMLNCIVDDVDERLCLIVSKAKNILESLLVLCKVHLFNSLICLSQNASFRFVEHQYYLLKKVEVEVK
jgi:hypothetical protein